MILYSPASSASTFCITIAGPDEYFIRPLLKSLLFLCCAFAPNNYAANGMATTLKTHRATRQFPSWFAIPRSQCLSDVLAFGRSVVSDLWFPTIATMICCNTINIGSLSWFLVPRPLVFGCFVWLTAHSVSELNAERSVENGKKYNHFESIENELEITREKRKSHAKGFAITFDVFMSGKNH